MEKIMKNSEIQQMLRESKARQAMLSVLVGQAAGSPHCSRPEIRTLEAAHNTAVRRTNQLSNILFHRVMRKSA